MKKVWILEKFVTHEDMVKTLNDVECLEKHETTENAVNEFICKYKKLIEENPEGMWSGFDGKSNYKTFCELARGSIRRNPGVKFRVVEAEIKDDATTWVGYTVVKENAGVLRYLFATK